MENTGTDRAYPEAIAYGYSSSGRILFIQESRFILWVNAGVSEVAVFYLHEHDVTYGDLSSIKIEISWANGKAPNEKTFRFGYSVKRTRWNIIWKMKVKAP